MTRKVLYPVVSLLAFLAFLGVGGLYLVQRHVDPNHYKTEMAFLLLDLTGRPVTIQGDIEFSWFPRLAMNAGPVRVANRPGFGPDDFMTIREVSLRVKVLPFLKKRLEVESVLLEDIQVDLRRQRDGFDNWGDLGDVLKDYSDRGNAAQSPAEDIVYFNQISFQSLAVKNATVTMRDELLGRNYSVSTGYLRTGLLQEGHPVDFETGFDLNGTSPDVSFSLSLEGLLEDLWEGEPNLKSGRVELDHLRGLPRAFWGTGNYPVKAGMECTWSHSNKTFQVETGSIEGPGLTLSFKGTLTDPAGNMSARGMIDSSSFDPATLSRKLVSRLPLAANSSLVRSAEMSAVFVFNKTVVEFRNMEGTLDSNPFSGHLKTTLEEDPSVDIFIRARDFPLEPYLLAAFGPEGEVGGDGLSKGVSVSTEGPRVSLEMDLGEQTVAGVQGSSVVLAVERSSRGVRLSTRADKVFGGGWSGDLHLAPADQKDMAADFKFSLNGFNAYRASRQFTGEDFLSGSGDVEGVIRSRGKDLAELLENIAGSMSLALREGLFSPLGGDDEEGRVTFSRAEGTLKLKHEASGRDASLDMHLLGPYGQDGPTYKFSISALGNLAANLKRSRYAVDDLKLWGTLEDGILPESSPVATLQATASYDPDTQAVVLRKGAYILLGVEGAFSADLNRRKQGGRFLSGEISSDQFDPKQFLGNLGIELPDPRSSTALKSAEFKSRFKAVPGRLELLTLKGNLDSTNFEGKVTVQKKSPMVSFDLDFTKFNLDGYMPPSSGDYDCKAPKTSPGSRLPLDTFRTLSLEGRTRFDEFWYTDLRFQNLEATVLANEGMLRADPVASNFYGGRFQGHLDAMATAHFLDVSLDLRASSFEAGRFFIDLADVPYIKGNSDLWFDLGTEGITDKDLLRNLHGNAGFIVRDGSYNFYKDQAAEMVLPEEIAKKQVNMRTVFDRASASLDVKNGVFYNDDLKVDSIMLEARGGGNFSLPDDTIDLKLMFTVGHTATVPVEITGCLSDPEDHVPKGELFGGIAKDIVDIPLKPLRWLRDLIF